jgi:Tfp pilus assembly protein PilZ
MSDGRTSIGDGGDARRTVRTRDTASEERRTTSEGRPGASRSPETNRRREPRIPMNAPVRISTLDPETDPGTGRSFFRSSDEVCENVSRTGLFIRTAEPLEPGRRLLVELQLPSGEDIDAVGRVAWVKKSMAPRAERGIGVELLGATSEELASLQSWIARSRGESHERGAADGREGRRGDCRADRDDGNGPESSPSA